MRLPHISHILIECAYRIFFFPHKLAFCTVFQTLDLENFATQVGRIVNNTRRRRPSSLLTTPIRQSTSRGCLLQVNWRQPRRGCRGHIPQYFGWGDVNGNTPPILLRTFGYSRPILVALRSLSLKPISFDYKTPPIHFSQAGGQSAHKARPPQP